MNEDQIVIFTDKNVVGKNHISAIKNLFKLTDIPSETIRKVLSDENWRVRKAAVEEMISHYPPDQIDELIIDMKNKHHDIGLLNSIIQILSNIGGDIVLPLIQLTQTDDNDLKIYALQTLGQQKDSRAIPTLIQALDDHDVNVKYHAIEALGKLKAIEAADKLITIIASNDFFQVFAALDALANMGAKQAVPRIIPLLQEPDLCEAVSEALGELGDSSITKHLAELINQSNTPIKAITRSLANLYKRCTNMNDEVMRIVHLTQNTINQFGVGHLIKEIKKNPLNDMQSLALVLGWLEGEEVEDAIISMIDIPEVNDIIINLEITRSNLFIEKMIKKLVNCSIKNQKKIITALGKIGNPIAVPTLINILKTVPDLIPVTVDALTKIGDYKVSEELIDLLGHPNPVVRRTIVSYLCSIKSDTLKNRILPMLMDPNPYIKESAVKIVTYFGYNDALENLITLAKDKNENVRSSVIEHIWVYDDPRIFDIIANAVKSDTPIVRVKAAETCEHINREKSIPLLKIALKDEFPRVRQSVIRVMGKIQLFDEKNLIAKIAQSDSSHIVRIAAIEFLGIIGGSDYLSLIHSLTKDDNTDIVISAIQTMGHMRIPEALSLLSDIIQSESDYKSAEAIYAIRFYDSKAGVNLLKQIIFNYQDNNVIEAAIESLSVMKSDEAVDALNALNINSVKRDNCTSDISKMSVNQKNT